MFTIQKNDHDTHTVGASGICVVHRYKDCYRFEESWRTPIRNSISLELDCGSGDGPCRCVSWNCKEYLSMSANRWVLAFNDSKQAARLALLSWVSCKCDDFTSVIIRLRRNDSSLRSILSPVYRFVHRLCSVPRATFFSREIENRIRNYPIKLNAYGVQLRTHWRKHGSHKSAQFDRHGGLWTSIIEWTRWSFLVLAQLPELTSFISLHIRSELPITALCVRTNVLAFWSSICLAVICRREITPSEKSSAQMVTPPQYKPPLGEWDCVLDRSLVSYCLIVITIHGAMSPMSFSASAMEIPFSFASSNA